MRAMVKNTIKIIIMDGKNHLYNELKQRKSKYLIKNPILFKNIIKIIFNDTFQLIHNDNSKISFLEIIRGIVPKKLSNNINLITRNKKTTNTILNNLLKLVRRQTNEQIWIPRCQMQIEHTKYLRNHYER